MYSYPAEYLLHPVPILALYGLTTADEPTDAESTTELSKSRSVLVQSLLNTFNSKTEYNLYEATRYLSNNQAPPPFRVITVPKDYTLPQKSLAAAPNVPPPHSNLSPLSHESPLFPDGVVTPLWIKKYLYLPSVVVGFYDLWDSNSSTKRETGPLASQVLVDPIERENDSNLAVEVNIRRKYFQDKGIKFAAVLILKQRYSGEEYKVAAYSNKLSHTLLKDQSIEERLTTIRKQCGLDTKNSFFTVAPGSTNEIQDFVNNLTRALYESAIQYYNNKLKKIRKKKSKIPSPSMVPRPLVDLSSTEPQPLSIPGWMLRYDYKAAFYLEAKGDIDGSLKSYETAYNVILDMLAPTSSITMGHVNLPVHSKRWKEARGLADCINIKICKFYLFLNGPTAALAQLNGHLHMFQSYSPTWGMGEQTFEYWAWLSKQYRIFADVIDAAIQAGYKVPLPNAILTNNNSNEMINSPAGCNPGAILQHPGFYYHLAAMCCAERRRRFLEMEKSVTPTATNDILAVEKQVDHSSLTIELLTKSYEQFKRYRNGRMTLYLAAEIAGTYYETGKFEMAIKFFERIGKTYRKEKWHMVLTSILRWSLRCAKELGNWERAVECLVELLADDLPMADHKRQDIQKELLDVLTVHPSANQEIHAPLVIQMDQLNAFIDCQVQIRKQTNFVGAPVEYQVVLKTNKSSPCAPFRFHAMKIVFSDPAYNLTLRDDGQERKAELLELFKFKISKAEAEDEEYTAETDLCVVKNQTKVYSGSVIPQDCGELKILSVSLELKTEHWQVELNYAIDKMTTATVEDHVVAAASRRKWLELVNEKPVFKLLDGRGHLSTANIMQKPPSIELKFDHAAPALLDELFKLDITMTSLETDPVEAVLIAEIKNSEGAVAEDYITFTTKDDNEDIGALKETNIGRIEPNQPLIKSIYLHGGRVTGSRLINITVKYTIVGGKLPVEKSDSIRIPFITPFDANFELVAQSEKIKAANLAPDLQKSERWFLSASIRCFSAWDLHIKHVSLREQDHSLKVISRMDDFDNQTWKTGHVYNANYLFRLSILDITEPQSPIPSGTVHIEWKRKDTEEEEKYYKSIIRLPPIQFQQQQLVVRADIPSQIYLGEAFTTCFTIDNPTEHLAEYTASIELSEAFVFSGYKQLKGKVLPLSKVQYRYTCYPLIAGKVKLPKLKVMATQHQAGEIEVTVEVAGTGTSIFYNNELQPKSAIHVQSQAILAFVNAKRKF